MKKNRIVCIIVAIIISAHGMAQMFTHGAWEQKNLFSAKMSELYYELNVGINLTPEKRSADFVYVAFGYGTPTKKNAWRKFTPENDIPEGLPKALKEKLSNSGTDDLHAGKIGIGWNHWFNHIMGCYVQAGWGFIADLSTGDDLTEEEKSLLSGSKERKTFIYNTVPVELGMTLNVWKHYHLQAGVTYMWKEIPLLTVGVGYAF